MPNGILPDPLFDYARLNSALMPVAYVLLVGGLIGAIKRAPSPKEMLFAMIQASAVVALISNFAAVGNLTQEAVDEIVVDELKASPADVAEHYANALLAAKQDSSSASQGFWQRLIKAPLLLVEGMLTVLAIFAALIGAVLFCLAYLVQQICFQFGYALAPPFLACLMIASARSIGFRYLLNMASVATWPLGWAAASLVTDQLIRYATDQSFLVDPSTTGTLGFAARNLISSVLLSIWVIFSTLAAPWAIHKTLTSGAQMGTALLTGSINVIRHR